MKTKKNTPKEKTISNEMNDEIIDILKKHLPKMDVSFDDKQLSNKIYDKMTKSWKESEKIPHEYTLEDMKPSSNEHLKPTQFMPTYVLKCIHNTLHYQYCFTFEHKKIKFRVFIYFDGKIQFQQYIKYIKWIICLCLHNINNETEDFMNIHLYMTSLKKTIPSNFPNSIQPIHINSGFTSYPNNGMHICIFRKEEWMKVLIHECFHAFNMDFNEERINFPNLFENTFHINSKYLVFESFVEFWARILNCAFFSYGLKPNISSQDFHDVFSLNLNIERIHSLSQASKMMNMFQLKYADFINNDRSHIVKKIYREETNAFCYYVITAIMMNFFDKTLQWFDLNNNDLFYFNKNERQVIVFCHYIKQMAKNPDLVSILDELNVYKVQKQNYMKMCIFEIEFK
jgi:hypothetical protein